MKTGRLNLGLKFSIAVTLLILVIMVAVATLIINYQRDALRQNTFDNNLLMTRNLAHDSIESLLIFDPLRLDKLVTTILDATSCTYAMIIDRDGTVVAHTTRSILGSRLGGEQHQEMLQKTSEGDEFIREYKADEGLIQQFSVPIKIHDEILGASVVAFSVQDIDVLIEERISKLRRYIYLITGIMVAAGISGAFVVSSRLTKPLKNLKDTMHQIQSGNLEVEAENKNIVKCWERLGCTMTDCPSYGKLRCWAIAGTFCHGEVQGQFAQKIGDCRKCVVYKESCGDEIYELIEVFNQMVDDLKYNLGELEKANTEKDRLERLSMLGEMATTVAHETKNPLNSIQLATSYLKKNFQGEILSEFLGIIEEEVRRLNDITSNFLAFSRPAPMKVRPGDINTLVKSVVDLIRQEATDRNIEIVLLTDENIPQMEIDVARIKQAVLNLLINAMDASTESDTITVATELNKSYADISVRDTGKGITEEEKEKIFKPFYTTKTRGSGLGLAIVERIAKEHKGEIHIDTAVAKGVKFILRLPV